MNKTETEKWTRFWKWYGRLGWVLISISVVTGNEPAASHAISMAVVRRVSRMALAE